MAEIHDRRGSFQEFQAPCIDGFEIAIRMLRDDDAPERNRKLAMLLPEERDLVLVEMSRIRAGGR